MHDHWKIDCFILHFLFVKQLRCIQMRLSAIGMRHSHIQYEIDNAVRSNWKYDAFRLQSPTIFSLTSVLEIFNV